MGNTQSVEKINDTTFDTNILKLKLAIENSELQSLIDNIDSISSFVSLPLSEENRGEVNKLVLEALDPKLSDKDFKKRVFEVVKKYRILEKNKKTTKKTAQVKVDNLNNSLLDATQIFLACKENPILKGLIVQIEKDFKKLTDTNDKNRVLGELQAILNLDKNDVDYSSSIRIHLDSINAITNPKKTSAKPNENSSSGVGEVSEENSSFFDGIKSFIFDTDELNEIQAIDIDGKVETMQEFNTKLKQLIEVIKKSKGFKKLPIEQQTKIITGLQKLGSGLEKQQNKTLDFLDGKINTLAKEIENSTTEPLTITIEGQSVQFSSKKEAFEFVRNLKSEAEDEFQSFLTDLGEVIGDSILNLFSTDSVLLEPYKLVRDSAIDMYENEQDNQHWSFSIVDGLQILFWSIIAVNYTETMWRRIVADNLGRFGISRFTIGEFDRVRNTFHSNSENTKVQEEGNNRMDAYRYLQDNIGNVKPENRKAYLKELENIRKSMQFSSRTFWLKERALRKEHGILGRARMGIQYGPKFTPFNIERTEKDFIKLNMDNRGDSVKNSLGYVFEKNEISIDTGTPENPKFEISTGEETENTKNLRNYINSIEDEARRKKILTSFNAYLKELKVTPKPEGVIKDELFDIIENNFATKEELKQAIKDEFFKESKWRDVERKGLFKWVGESFDFSRQKFGELKLKSADLFGKWLPTSFTYGKALAIKHIEMIDNDQWKGSLEELKTQIIDPIKTQKLKLNIDYPHVWKVTAPFVGLRSIFGKYGLTLPNISKMRKFSNRKMGGKSLQTFIKIGENIETNKKQVERLFNGDFAENLGHIFDLDNENFPDKATNEKMSETDVEKMYDQFKKSILNDGVHISSDNAKLELIKIYSGYLEKGYVRRDIEFSFSNDELKKDNVKDFLSRLDKGEYFIEFKDLDNLKNALKNGGNIDLFVKTQGTISILENGTIKDIEISQRNDSMSEQEIKDLEGRISEVETHINDTGNKLGEIHFKNPKFEIPFDATNKLHLDTFKKYIALGNLLHISEGNGNYRNSVSNLLDKIARGNDFTSIQFFGELKKSLGISTDMGIDETTKMSDFSSILESKLKAQFETDGFDKKKFLSDLQDIVKNLSEEEKNSILPQVIKDALDNEGKGQHIETMRGFIEQLKTAPNKSKVYDNFYDFTTKQSITRESGDEFKKVFDEFEAEFAKQNGQPQPAPNPQPNPQPDNTTDDKKTTTRRKTPEKKGEITEREFKEILNKKARTIEAKVKNLERTILIHIVNESNPVEIEKYKKMLETFAGMYDDFLNIKTIRDSFYTTTGKKKIDYDLQKYFDNLIGDSLDGFKFNDILDRISIEESINEIRIKVKADPNRFKIKKLALDGLKIRL